MNWYGKSTESTSFEDHSIDVIIINQVLHHIMDQEAAKRPTKEFSRVLRDGGARDQHARSETAYRRILVG